MSLLLVVDGIGVAVGTGLPVGTGLAVGTGLTGLTEPSCFIDGVLVDVKFPSRVVRLPSDAEVSRLTKLETRRRSFAIKYSRAKVTM